MAAADLCCTRRLHSTGWATRLTSNTSPRDTASATSASCSRIMRSMARSWAIHSSISSRRPSDAWRNMIDAVNANAMTLNGRKQYPTMYGPNGWYGWQAQPWNVGALELWYWSMKPSDLERVGGNNAWITYLQGRNPSYPEAALR